MIKRKGFEKILTIEQTERLNKKACPICGKERKDFDKKRHLDWPCCSNECTSEYFKTTSYYWPSIRLKALIRDNYTCVKCGDNRKYIDFRNNLIVDHIKPIALGGSEWDLQNLQTLCRSCNKVKTSRDLKIIALQRKWRKQ